MRVEKIGFSAFLDKTKGKEGIVCLGAGGDLQKWIKGIPEMWVEEKISKTKSPEKCFSNTYKLVSTGGRTDLAMIFKKDSNLNIGKMAMWRLRFGDCSWISDYKTNYAAHFL